MSNPNSSIRRTPGNRTGHTPIVQGYFIESSAFVDTSDFTFRTLLHFLKQWWRRISLSILLATGLSFTAFLFSTPIYRSTVIVLPAADSENAQNQLLDQIGGLASLAGLAPTTSSGNELKLALAFLKSDKFAIDFVRQLELEETLFPKRWDSTTHTWRNGKPPTDDDIIDLLEGIRKITQNRETGTISLRMEWTDPEAAANWANAQIDRANLLLRSTAIEEAEKKIAFLKEQVSETNISELKQAIYRLMEHHIKAKMVASIRPEYAFRIVDPARAAARDHPVRPRLIAYLAFGLFAGMTIGIVLASIGHIGLIRQQERV